MTKLAIIQSLIIIILLMIIFTKDNSTDVKLIESNIHSTNNTIVTNLVNVTNKNDKIYVSNIIHTKNDMITSEVILNSPIKKHLYGINMGLSTDIYGILGFSYINKQQNGLSVNLEMCLTNYKQVRAELIYTRFF